MSDLTERERQELIDLLAKPCHVEISWLNAAGSYDRRKLNRSEQREIVTALRSQRSKS